VTLVCQSHDMIETSRHGCDQGWTLICNRLFFVSVVSFVYLRRTCAHYAMIIERTSRVLMLILKQIRKHVVSIFYSDISVIPISVKMVSWLQNWRERERERETHTHARAHVHTRTCARGQTCKHRNVHTQADPWSHFITSFLIYLLTHLLTYLVHGAESFLRS